MPYVTSIERLAHQDGREEGRKEGREKGVAIGLRDCIEIALELRFSADGLQLMPAIRAIDNAEALRSVLRTALTDESLDAVRIVIQQAATSKTAN